MVQDSKILKPYSKKTLLHPEKISSNYRSWYNGNEIAKIYNFPVPDITKKVNIGVVSFGGGLFGNVDSSGYLTNGDVHSYWASLGIKPSNMPKVKIIKIDSTINNPSSDINSTTENTVDIEQIGACFPSSNLTIYFYLAQNSTNGFINIFNYILNNTVIGVDKPNVVSISWGAPEVYFDVLTTTDDLFVKAISQGINICVASGDNGSSDGIPGLNVDFPASSPHVIACGGTTLTCPNLIYDSNTTEVTWSGSGGGLSNTFTRPVYQSITNKPYRSVPDVALNADPNTGVKYLINGQYEIIGGTSIVAPAISAFIALTGINYFANTKLYTLNSSCFHDITRGNNGQYNAVKGYDNCTGLGSINGSLINALLNNLTIPATNLSLNYTSKTLNVPNTLQLDATILPQNATDKTVSWSSSNPLIASVNSYGLVSALATGQVTINAISNNITKTCLLTLIGSAITQIVFPNNTITITINQSTNNPVKVYPDQNLSSQLTWSSSNTRIVSVGNSGLLKGNSIGRAVITVKPINSLLSVNFTVVVTNSNSRILPINHLLLLKKS